MEDFYIPGFTNELFASEPDGGYGGYNPYGALDLSAYQIPQYAEPSYAEPLPQYDFSAYQAPQYAEPSYAEPLPQYDFSAYQAPQYAEPSYAEPLPQYDFSAYQAPQYAEPSYAEPLPQYDFSAYQAPQYAGPSYAAPAAEETPVRTYTDPRSDETYAQDLQTAAERAYEDARLKSFGARGELSPALDRIDPTEDFNYSPAALDYMRASDQYLGSQQTGYDLTPINIGTNIDKQTGALLPLTNTELEKFAQTPVEEQFYANFNNWSPDQEGGIGQMQFAPNKNYRLIDRATGQELYSGSGYEAGQNIAKLTNSLLSDKGTQANWVVQQTDPGSDQWTQRYEHVPDVNGFTTWLKMVAPMLGGAVLAPVLGGGALASAAGSAIGSAGAGIAAGDSLGDILKNAAISGVTSYAGNELFNKLGVGSSVANSAKVSELASNLQPGVLDTIDDLMSIGLAPSSATSIALAQAGQTLSNAGATAAQIANFNAGITGGAASIPTVFGNVGSTAANVGNLVGGLGAGTLSGALAAAQPSGVNYGDQVYDQPPAATVTANTAPATFAPPAVMPTSPLDLAVPPETVVEAAPKAEEPVSTPAVIPTSPLDLAVPPETVVEAAPKAEEPVVPPYNFNADFDATFGGGNPPPTVVEGTPKAEEPVSTPAVIPTSPLDLANTAPEGQDNGWDVVGSKEPTVISPPPVIPPLSIGDISASPDTTLVPKDTNVDVKEQPLPEAKQPLSLYEKLRLLSLGIGTIGNLFDGGGKSATNRVPAGLKPSGLSSVFSASLPTPSMPGFGTQGGTAARTASDLAVRGLSTPQDWYRYGYGPEQSFFANVPEGAKNTSTAYTGYETPFRGLEYMAQGGYAVGGPGDGRADKIPAMLSDGEYVMDAETVAMLGNGSSKAGADALDQFRVNIRKHKGRSLAKGDFSVNAKKPEQYLKKGRR